jgi:AcrR family transcriptional regulator
MPTSPHRSRLTRENRRAQIVAAASDVFRGRHPADVTFEEIADAAGISRALVYNYFGDRNGLMEAVYRYKVDQLQSMVDTSLATAAPGRATVERIVAAHLDMVVDDPDGYRYLAGGVPFAGLAELDGERIEQLANLLGGSPLARLAARGLLSCLQTMVVAWNDGSAVPRDDAVDLMTACLHGALRSLYPVGVGFCLPQSAHA